MMMMMMMNENELLSGGGLISLENTVGILNDKI
jgi:hypothetical protein